MLYVGEGPRGSNGACSTVCCISVTPSATHNQIGPLWCCFPGVWVCVWGWEFLVLPLPNSTGVFNQRFEEPWVAWSASLPRFLLIYLCMNVGPQCPPTTTLWGLSTAACPVLFHKLRSCWIRQLPPCREYSPPSCLSPPLLLVWMNVSSWSPWLSDFHAVRFSVSSGGFLFLNCCCPSFGCARRHSVSTYTPILAGSPRMLS